MEAKTKKKAKLTGLLPITTGVLVAQRQTGAKGKRGFVKKEVKRDSAILLRVTNDMHDFLNEYAGTFGCTVTELLLRGVECTTGYNGKNAKQILKEAKIYKGIQDIV
jgi:hypothetical protein